MNLLADSVGFVNMIKRVALAAVKASKPVEICFGRVVGISPLKISVEQKMSLGEKQLVLSRHVTDYETVVNGGNIQNYYYTGTEPDTELHPVSPQHVHAVGNIPITIHNGLVVGDEVMILRQQGGQKYIVWDKIG